MMSHRTDAACCIHALRVKCNTPKTYATVVAVEIMLSARLIDEQVEEKAKGYDMKRKTVEVKIIILSRRCKGQV